MEKQLVVERRLKRRVEQSRVTRQIQRLCALAMKGRRGKGWTFGLSGRIREPKFVGGVWVYRVKIIFETTTNRATVVHKWPAIAKRFAEAGTASGLAVAPWRVIQPEGFCGVPGDVSRPQSEAPRGSQLAEQPKTLGKIHLDGECAFDKIFGREPHIRLIRDAIRLATETNWQKRMHTLLFGPPGSGKSEILRALASTLGEENEAYKWFDAPTMTRAGAVEVLMKSTTIPPVLFLEEVEKVEEQALRRLLGVMDTRGVIRRTNYRVGDEARNVRMLVVATANDPAVLRSQMSGALFSRFQNRIYCAPPDRDVMRKILEREVREINGKMEWVELALRFAYDEQGLRNPRDIIATLSLGRDRLLDNSFQRDRQETREPEPDQPAALNGSNGRLHFVPESR